MPRENLLSSDNQMSTVLLLVALGFLIYYLTKSSDKKEGFAASEEVTLQNEKQADTEQVQRQAITEQVQRQVNTEQVQRQVNTEQVQRQMSAEQPSTVSEGNQEVPVFNYEANDVYQSGADLDSAFERPIPQSANPSAVDINKNNVSKYNAKDFLPKEINSEWFDTDFSQAKYNVNDDKLINTERYVIGINTVGQSLKNASYDIRGTIPNPKYTISPWNNSTYEPDFNLKPLC